MNDMMLFSDNISGFSVCRSCPPSEGVRKTQETARLRKVGKVRWTGKCGERHFSWRCCICPPSEGVQKTRKNARLRKVGKVRWTEKCSDRYLSWRCCISPPSEGVQKTRKNAHLRKVDWKEDQNADQEVGWRVLRRTGRKTGRKQCRRTAGIGARVTAVIGMLLLCAVSLGYQSRAEELPANGYAWQQKAADDDGNRISGVVVEAGKGTPVAGAVVLYVPAGQDGTEYALSDVQGRFELQVSGMPAAGDSVRVSMLGYATVTLALVSDGNSVTDWRNIKVELQTQALVLNEVFVRAPKVNLFGDTVEFNVQSFVEQQDKSISDVLKRMPGVEVREGGDIYYNGESIGNLYVEGMDLLGGRYSLLTKNLSAQDVKKVEIIEKHQPVKALKGITSGEKPAINLVLQDQARGKWVGSAALAGGVTSDPQALWDGNLFLMRVGRKWNSVNNIKTNNAGEDLSGDLRGMSLYDRSGSGGGDGFISVGTSEAPLGAARVRFNTSALANTSNTWKLRNDWKLNASASYVFDRLESSNSSETTYYFEDGERTVTEGEEAMTRQHNVQARVEAEANRDEYFFRNVLRAEGSFQDAIQTMTGQYPNTQKARLPYIFVSDDIRYIHRKGGRSLTLMSQNDFTQYDQRLTVLRDGDGNGSAAGLSGPQDNASGGQALSSDGGAGSTQRQLVGISDFNTNTYVSTDFRVARSLTLGLTGGFTASVRRLDSRLEGMGGTGVGSGNSGMPQGASIGSGAICNDLTAAYIRPYVTPSLKYDSKSWEVRLSAPVSWAKYWGLDTDRFIYRASGSVKYMPGPRLSLTVSGSASNSALDIHDFYSGYILRNYRYLTVGSMNTAQDESYSVSGRINFKDPVNMFYIDGTVGRSWNILQTSSTQDFLGDYIVTGTEYAPSRGESWYASLSSSIGIYGINGKVGVTLSYMDFSTTSILQDGVRTPYLSQTISLRPTFNGRLTRWMSLSYELGYSHFILSLPGTGTSESKDNFSHTMSLNLSPHRSLDLKLSAEHYYTMLTTDQAKNTVLLDASVAWRLKGGVELSLTARNLLNQRTYAYSIFNALQQFSCEYRIRPLNILAGVYFTF